MQGATEGQQAGRGTGRVSVEGRRVDEDPHGGPIGTSSRQTLTSACWVASSALAESTFANKLRGGCTPKCFKQWELTCSAGGCDNLGPFIDNVKVLCSLVTWEADRVYWRLNVPKTPHVPWETVGDQGLTAAWGLIDADGCPTVVQNSLGHVYDITFP